MSSSGKIVFRADGNSRIGMGHVMRCLALADMLKARFECYFMIQIPVVAIREQILALCKGVIELEESEDYQEEARSLNRYLERGDIVVLDGYFFQTDYQNQLKLLGCKVVCIDDLQGWSFVANMIINHAGGVKISDYHVKGHPVFCLGLAYAMLRRPFLEAARSRQYKSSEVQVFICLGGADPHFDTLSVLQRCETIPAMETVHIVIGRLFLYETQLKQYIAQSRLTIKIHRGLSAEEMVNLMSDCGMAICSPSTVAYEYLCVGGLLFVYQTAANQAGIYRYFIKSGLAFDLKRLGRVGTEEYQKAIHLQQQLLDGKSDDRLLKAFQKI